MTDQDKSPPPSPDSSSVSALPSRDALDSGSARDLTRALDGHSQRLDSLKVKVDSIERMAMFRDRSNQRALELNTAALERHDSRIDSVVRIVREVLAEERKAIGDGMAKLGRVVEDTSKHMLPAIPDDEITGRHIRKLFVSKIIPFAIEHGVILKIISVAVTLAGAAWVVLSRLAQYLPGHH